MESIRHRVGIAIPPERVFAALTTTAGLKGWWTQTLAGDPGKGGSVQFYFGSPEPSTTMQVVDLIPNQKVAWSCVQGPDEWVGTHLTFALQRSEAAGETVILFEHADWREPVEFMYHCSTKWAYFLLGLKGWLEGGESVAYPNDLHISSWDS